MHLYNRFLFGALFFACFYCSCSKHRDQQTLDQIFGVQYTANVQDTAQNDAIFKQLDAWLRQIEVDLSSSEFNYAEVRSGDQTGFIVALQATHAAYPSSEPFVFKGTPIYKWGKQLYSTELGDKVLISTFPTALQEVIRVGAVEISELSHLNVDQWLEYWINETIREPNLNSSQILRMDGSFQYEMEYDPTFGPVSETFQNNCIEILTPEDSYLFRSLPLEAGASARVDQCWAWSGSSIMIIIDQFNGAVDMSQGAPELIEEVYGMVDIYQMATDWKWFLSGETYLPLQNAFYMEWEDVLVISDDFTVLERKLSQLILNEVTVEVPRVSSVGEFYATHLRQLSSKYWKLPSSIWEKLPEKGIWSFNRDSTLHIKLNQSDALITPELIQGDIGDQVDRVYAFFDINGQQKFMVQDSLNRIYGIDKRGGKLWIIPAKQAIKSCRIFDQTAVINFGGFLDLLDLQTGQFLNSPIYIPNQDSLAWGLVEYFDRPILEQRIWYQKSKRDSIRIFDLAQDYAWSIPSLKQNDCGERIFIPLDTSDVMFEYCAGALHARNLQGGNLFDPIPMEPLQPITIFTESNGSLRFVVPEQNGKVKVFNRNGNHFGLMILEGMKNFLLENMNDGPRLEYIGYSDDVIQVSGYLGNTFKVLHRYKHNAKILDLKYAASPRGKYLSVVELNKVTILDEQLNKVAAFDVPSNEYLDFYFDEFNSALVLVLIDGSRILNFILEEL